jgi:NADPH2:quinone reductase
MAIRALVADPRDPVTMRMADVPEPCPSANDVVVEVRRVSLNPGDLNDAVSGRIPPGGVLGSDLAGVVVATAADAGPAVGARVVGLAAGAFAERVAVAVDCVAELPTSVQLEAAAGLPVAGLAALRTLRASGSLLGKRVLITGASGGVGGFAVQLAAAAGAHVIASVGTPARGEGLRERGADEIVIGLAYIERGVDVVLDSVGGPQLVRAWELLARGGTLHSIGWSSGEPATLPPYATVGPAKSLSSHLTLAPFAADLGLLTGLVAAGKLHVDVGWRGSWTQIAEAAAALRDRRVRGKAILDVT